MSGTLIGVGVGPGDPEHLTLKALATLRRVDRVVAPSTSSHEVGRAESIVRQAAPELTVHRLPFAMATGAAARRASAQAAAAVLGPWLDAGEQIAFVTLGDPNIYSTFSAISAHVRAQRPETTIGTVPGITAFQDLAARTGTVLLDDVETLTLVTAIEGTQAVADALVEPSRAVVVYKGGRHLPAMTRVLAEAGRLEGAVIGELLGLPGERVGPLAEASDQPASYLATIVVPPAGRP